MMLVGSTHNDVGGERLPHGERHDQCRSEEAQPDGNFTHNDVGGERLPCLYSLKHDPMVILQSCV